MDLTQDVTYPSAFTGGPISLNDAAPGSSGEPTSGRSINRVEWLGVQGIGYTEKRAQASGIDSADVFDGALRLRISGTQYGATVAELADGIRLLRSAFSAEMAYYADPEAQGYLPLTFHELSADLLSYPTGDIPLVLYCRPLGQPSFDEQRYSMGGAAARGGSIPWSVVLEAKDPIRYAAAARTYTEAAATSGTLIDLLNYGDRPAAVEITLSVPAPGGAGVFSFSGAGASMTIQTEASAIDTTYKLGADRLLWVTRNGATTLRMDLLDIGSAGWPTVPPNTISSINWAMTVLTAGSFTLTLSTRDSYA